MSIEQQNEKHRILENSLIELREASKNLNKVMNANAVTVDARVVLVSGMLLAMKGGLTPDDLVSGDPETSTSDGNIIYKSIETFLDGRDIDDRKRKVILGILSEVKKDGDYDRLRPRKSKQKKGKANTFSTANKEIFEFIYHNIFKTIEDASYLDTLGSLYSEFIKTAIGDGKDNGIVLTPPYVTKLMNELIDVNPNSYLLDVCTGSGGFLVSGLAIMLDELENNPKYSNEDYKQKVKHIKEKQLLGIELNAKLYALASANMILRGGNAGGLIKGSAFEYVKNSTITDTPIDRALLNPPYNYDERGMPFTLVALDALVKEGLGAVIIQESAGSGQAIETNKEILSRHTLLASIRMPFDLFQPAAGVQVSIYIFKAHVPHDFSGKVKFINFSEDGYKRTGRGLAKIGNPERRYKDLLDIYRKGKHSEVFDSASIDYLEEVITDSGKDWNYTQHRVINTTPTEEDFMKVVGDYLSWEVSRILEGRDA